MTIREIAETLDATWLCCEEEGDRVLRTAFASDMMSDVLACVTEDTLLLTGLVNGQCVRTCEMLDVPCVVFVRSKEPLADALDALGENPFGGETALGIDAENLQRLAAQAKIMARKYDVVVTNPPYMGSSGMGARLAEFVKKQYPDSKSDMSTVFMQKCMDYCTESGYMSMINIPVWMFLSSYEKLRKDIIEKKTIVSMAHFGRGIFGSDFGTTSFVISNKHVSKYLGSYRRLFEKQGAVDSVEQKEEWYLEGKGRFVARQDSFEKIPGAPVAYWVSENVRKCFEASEKIGTYASPRQGLATGNNEVFLKLWFEVNANDININACNYEMFEKSKKKYIPYNKGGAFRKWFAFLDCVIRFDKESYEILSTTGNHLPSRELYFHEAISWSKVTSGSLSMRYVPTGSAFDVAGCSIFSKENLDYLLGFTNSNVMLYLMNTLSQTLNYEVGNVKQMPLIFQNLSYVEQITRKNKDISHCDIESFETSWDFRKHPMI